MKHPDYTHRPQNFRKFLRARVKISRLALLNQKIKASRQVTTIERQKIEPLMVQLRNAREKLMAVGPGRINEKDIKALADKQAGLLAKLIVANAHMNAKVYKPLTPEQQLVIRRIHVSMRLVAPEETREKVERVHAVYAMSCPLYRTLQNAIRLTSSFELIDKPLVPPA